MLPAAVQWEDHQTEGGRGEVCFKVYVARTANFINSDGYLSIIGSLCADVFSNQNMNFPAHYSKYTHAMLVYQRELSGEFCSTELIINFPISVTLMNSFI